MISVPNVSGIRYLEEINKNSFNRQIGLLYRAINDFKNGITAPNIMPSVKDWGAKGDNVTDDTNAIQTAINNVGASGDGALYFPTGNYKISNTLQLVAGSNLIGAYVPGGAVGTTITQTVAKPIFRTVTTNTTTPEQQRCSISGFNLVAGTSGFYAQNGGVGITLRNIFFQAQTDKAIYFRGFMQEVFMYDIQVTGGSAAYGWYHAEKGLQNDGVSVGTAWLFDKSHIYGAYFNQCSPNAIYIDALTQTGNLVTFMDIRINSTRQSGIILKGSLTNFSFIGVNSETTGLAGPTRAQSTATTTAGSATVTIAAASNFVNGQVVTIQGAGTNGADWYPTISSGGGTTTLVMTTTAPLAVTAATIANDLYSDFILDVGTGSANTPINLIIMGYQNGGNGRLRYSVDASRTSSTVLFLNCRVLVPMYDPFSLCTILGSNFETIKAQNYNGQQLFRPTFESGFSNATSHATLLGSPKGRDVCLGLVDTNANGTGTYGKLTIRTSAVNANTAAPEVAYIDGSGNIASGVAGSGYLVKEGSNAKMGTATLSAGTVTVSTTAVTANSRIFLTSQETGSNRGTVFVSARNAGASFAISSTNILDSSVVAWIIFEPS